MFRDTWGIWVYWMSMFHECFSWWMSIQFVPLPSEELIPRLNGKVVTLLVAMQWFWLQRHNLTNRSYLSCISSLHKVMLMHCCRHNGKHTHFANLTEKNLNRAQFCKSRMLAGWNSVDTWILSDVNAQKSNPIGCFRWARGLYCPRRFTISR